MRCSFSMLTLSVCVCAGAFLYVFIFFSGCCRRFRRRRRSIKMPNYNKKLGLFCLRLKTKSVLAKVYLKFKTQKRETDGRFVVIER